MNKPILKIVDGPSPTKNAASQAVTLGLAPALSAISKAADVFPHDVEGLRQILHFRNQTARAAHRRSGWFGGRMYNRLSGEDTDYIPLSGTHLRQTLLVVGIEPPDFIKATGKYLLRLDISQEAVDRLSVNIGQPAL